MEQCGVCEIYGLGLAVWRKRNRNIFVCAACETAAEIAGYARNLDYEEQNYVNGLAAARKARFKEAHENDLEV